MEGISSPASPISDTAYEAPTIGRMEFAFLTLAGQNVSVFTSDGAVWEGIFVATDAKASDAVLLSCAVRAPSKDHSGSEPAVWFDKCYIPMESIMMINAVDVKMQTGNTASEKVVSTKPAPLPENPTNMKWDEDVSMDFEAEEKNWKQGKGWDQFAENERKFGVKSTYNEELYTTKMGKYTPAQMAEADRKARDIETSVVTGGIQQRIERGEDVDMDEGEMYSDVKRTDNRSAPMKADAAAAPSKSRGKKGPLWDVICQPNGQALPSNPTTASISNSISASQSADTKIAESSHSAPVQQPSQPASTYVAAPQFTAPPPSFYGNRRFHLTSALIEEVSLAAEACLAPYFALEQDYSNKGHQSPPTLTPLPQALSHEVYMLSSLSAPLAWPRDDSVGIDVAAERLSCYGSRRYSSMGGDRGFGTQSNHSDSGRAPTLGRNASAGNFGQPPPSPSSESFSNYNEAPSMPQVPSPFYNNAGGYHNVPQGQPRSGNSNVSGPAYYDSNAYQNPPPQQPASQGGPSPNPNLQQQQYPQQQQQFYNKRVNNGVQGNPNSGGGGGHQQRRGWDEPKAYMNYGPPQQGPVPGHRQQPQQPTQTQQVPPQDDERSASQSQSFYQYDSQPYQQPQPQPQHQQQPTHQQRQPPQNNWRQSPHNNQNNSGYPSRPGNVERTQQHLSQESHDGYNEGDPNQGYNNSHGQMPNRQMYDQGPPPPRGGGYGPQDGGYQQHPGYQPQHNDSYDQYPPAGFEPSPANVQYNNGGGQQRKAYGNGNVQPSNQQAPPPFAPPINPRHARQF